MMANPRRREGNQMKVRDYLRQPGVKWVSRMPTSEAETCLAFALNRCYSNDEIGDVVRAQIEKHLGIKNLVLYNDSHTFEEVLALVDKLDI